jgi:hypothetical protein
VSWYAKYIDNPIFLSLGEGGVSPSTLFKQYFRAGHVEWIGKCNRIVPSKAREVVNTSFLRFCREKGVAVPMSHRMVWPNIHASFKSISKYDRGQPELDRGSWLLAGEWTKQHFKPYLGGSGILSQEDVLTQMDMTTSCGYPWSLKFPNKSEMLEHPAIAVLGDYWDIIGSSNEDNIVPIWTCSQKVELRTMEKLLANKVRTFTAAPFEHSVATNRMCLDTNNKFYASHGYTWSFVGATKYLGGWDKLHTRLSRHPNAFALDETDYDASLFREALFGQVEFRYEMLSRECQTFESLRRLKGIYEPIVDSTIVLENGELILKSTGQPSGSSNTIVDNTIILFRLFCYAYIVLCERRSMVPRYSEFMSNVEAALNGDDNTFTVSDLIVKWFNPVFIKEVWSGIGVITKSDFDEPKKIEEVSFLSQGFRWDQRLRIWLPVPDCERVLSSLMWGANIDDVRWHYLRACALRLDTFGNEECRGVLADYLNFLDVHYKDQLVGSVHGIEMSAIRSVWKSDRYIEAFYSGYENEVKQSSSVANKYTGATLISSNNSVVVTDPFVHLLSVIPFFPSILRTFKTVFPSSSFYLNMGKTKNWAKPGWVNPNKKQFGPLTKAQTKKQIRRDVAQAEKSKRIVGKYRASNGRKRKGFGPTNMVVKNPHKFNPSGSTITTMQSQRRNKDGRVPFDTREHQFANINNGVYTVADLYYLNPGNNVLFPWMAPIAAHFEQFRVNHLTFRYLTRMYQANGTNLTAGKVVMAVNYDPTDPAFSDQNDMTKTHKFVEFPPYVNEELNAVNTERQFRDDTLRNYYVNYSANQGADPLAAGANDNRWYDYGTFQIMPTGVPTTSPNSIVGDLLVEYSFTLIRDKVPPPATFAVAGHAVGQTSSLGVDALNGFALRNGSLTLARVSNDVFQFTVTRHANYMINYVWNLTSGVGPVIAGMTQSWTFAPNTGAVDLFYVVNGDTSNLTTAIEGSVTAVQVSSVAFISGTTTGLINVTVPHVTVYGLGVGSWDLFVTQLPPSLNVEKLSDVEQLRKEVAKLRTSLTQIVEDEKQNPPYEEDSEPYTELGHKEERTFVGTQRLTRDGKRVNELVSLRQV